MALAWRMSLRIGLLAALLLGPAAAIGVASRLPGLISGPRDAIVVTLYLAAIFGAAATLASWAVSLAVRTAARNASASTARRIGIFAGTLTGIASLVYLTLWWGATGGAVWSSPVRTLVALAGAVAVSLLLGHAVAVSALALLAREERGLEDLRAPATSWPLLLAAGGLAFLAASGLLAASATPRGSTAAEVPDMAVVPTGQRVLVLGMDGFDRRLFEEVSSTGALPHLSRLLRHARIAEPMPREADPAAVWTTVATGVRPDEHGVTALELRRLAGVQGSVESGSRSAAIRAVGAVTDLLQLTRPSAATAIDRRHKTMWEVAADKGLNAAVVNWWATWPATGTRATVISDRAPLRLERGGAQSAEIAPAALYEPLRARWPAIVALARELASQADESVRRSAWLDAEQVLVARDPLLGAPDLLAVYLPGLDIAQHALLQRGGEGPLPPSILAARLEILRGYYRYLDRIVGELLGEAGDDSVIVTVTHPGRVGGDARASIAISGEVASAPHGAMRTSLLDVAPTTLYLLGVPISNEFAGRPLLDSLRPDFIERHPVREVASYGRYAADAPPGEGAPLDREMMERLRSLGYIR